MLHSCSAHARSDSSSTKRNPPSNQSAIQPDRSQPETPTCHVQCTRIRNRIKHVEGVSTFSYSPWGARRRGRGSIYTIRFPPFPLAVTPHHHQARLFPSHIDAASLIKRLDPSSSFLVHQHRTHLSLGACLLAFSSLATCHRTIAQVFIETTRRQHHVWERPPLGQHRH